MLYGFPLGRSKGGQENAPTVDLRRRKNRIMSTTHIHVSRTPSGTTYSHVSAPTQVVEAGGVRYATAASAARLALRWCSCRNFAREWTTGTHWSPTVSARPPGDTVRQCRRRQLERRDAGHLRGAGRPRCTSVRGSPYRSLVADCCGSRGACICARRGTGSKDSAVRLRRPDGHPGLLPGRLEPGVY